MKELTPTELLSWSTLNGISLSPWESNTLMISFIEYRRYCELSRNPDFKDPTMTKEETQKNLNESLLATFRRLKANKG